jgi:ABC-type uncharacterized transport system permease subunit
MSLHVHILVCHFTCTYYRYPTSCAYHPYASSCAHIGMSRHIHIIGMSLHVHILLVCHFTFTYYWYVTSCVHTVGMSPCVHVLSVYHFLCTYCRYVTLFPHTMNVVFKLCPHSSVSKFVVLYCLLSRLKGTCTLERYVNGLKCVPSMCLVGHCLYRKVIRSLSASGCVGMSRAAGCRR